MFAILNLIIIRIAHAKILVRESKIEWGVMVADILGLGAVGGPAGSALLCSRLAAIGINHISITSASAMSAGR